MRRVLELDGLRAFAVLSVMACHYYPFSTMLFKLPEFGWVGVDFFFVLSGFLITGILLNLKSRPHPYKVFYARRILRIFPPYYAVISLIFIIAVAQHDPFSWLRYSGKLLFLQSFSNEPKAVSEFVHHLRSWHSIPGLLTSAPMPIAADRFPLIGFDNASGPTWSLSIEEWFYILWAPLALHMKRRTLGFVCIAICAAAFLLRWLGFLGIFSYFDFFSRIDVLMAGALLAIWADKRATVSAELQKRGDSLIKIGAVLGILGFIVILLAIRPVVGFEIRDNLLFMTLGLPLLALSFAGLINHVVRHQNTNGLLCNFLRLRPFVAIGAISYTLYLVHIPIYFLANQAALKAGVDIMQYNPALCISTISVVLSITAAYLSFKFFESPILGYKDKLTDRLTLPKQ
jgi:peptidoglycan/LPS O-acetylase OafA/YrhL